MKIAILGAGNIGRTLGVQWGNAGHEVVFGVREVHSPKATTAVARTGGAARAVLIREAIQFGEVILFAIPWGTVAPTMVAHREALADKILIDASTQLGESTGRHPGDLR